MHRGYTTPLVIAIMAFAVVAFLFLIDTAINSDGSKKTTNTLVVNKSTNNVACTLEAKICPDGSAVGRSGPNCEFAECPTTTNTNSATNQNTNTATDPTAGWKTFENTQYHWTLKYPADWKIVNDSDDPIMGQVFFSNSFNVSNTKYASLDAWKKQMLSYESEIYKVTISSTTVDGLDALWVDVYSLPSETPFFSNIGVWKDGLIVNFAAKEKDKMPQDVVRSFTFTD